MRQGRALAGRWPHRQKSRSTTCLRIQTAPMASRTSRCATPSNRSPSARRRSKRSNRRSSGGSCLRAHDSNVHSDGFPRLLERQATRGTSRCPGIMGPRASPHRPTAEHQTRSLCPLPARRRAATSPQAHSDRISSSHQRQRGTGYHPRNARQRGNMASIKKFHAAECPGGTCGCPYRLDYRPLGLRGPRKRLFFATKKAAEKHLSETVVKVDRGEYLELTKTPDFQRRRRTLVSDQERPPGRLCRRHPLHARQPPSPARRRSPPRQDHRAHARKDAHRPTQQNTLRQQSAISSASSAPYSARLSGAARPTSIPSIAWNAPLLPCAR